MTPAAPSRSPLLSILSDQLADEDQLNFDPYAKTLADIVADPGTDTPLTIGVFGGWGQGKTSLMRILRGGSWWNDDPATVCRCSYRGRFDPRFWSYFRGFRFARTLSS
jgi:hypothetical protein